MPRKRPPHRNATRRGQRAPTPAQSALIRGVGGRTLELQLRRVAEELLAGDIRRRELLAERSQVVADLRTRGWEWKRIAGAAGVSHAALIQAGKGAKP